MEVSYGKGSSQDNTLRYGTGVTINLTGAEVAIAIDAYLVSNRVYVNGPRTIRVNGELCKEGHVYVDPSGFVIHDGVKLEGRHGAEPGKAGSGAK